MNMPGEQPAETLSDERAAVLARRAAAGLDATGGRMLWPQYGVTPDIGTYGAGNAAADDACEPCARGGATVVALTGDQQAPTDANGTPLPASEPVLVNPTASMSGLLDKMAATGGQARALGLALAEWERLVRAETDDDCADALRAGDCRGHARAAGLRRRTWLCG